MKSIWEIPFIVVDVETSGAHPQNNRITEIACITSIGGEITNVYSSLVNPHQAIPYFISQMTGITNEMVFNAPELDEVVPKIDEFFNLSNAVFVAHNARFDWGFVCESYNLANLSVPKIPRLCTLKLSRRLLNKNLKKNVGSLAQHFNINVKNRHRASGDAIATAHILNELLEIAESEHDISDINDILNFQNKQIRNFRTPTITFKRIENRLNELPDEPGIYRFYGKNETLLYIGKAKSLKNRVKSYFNREVMASKKISEMLKQLYDIQWETTNSELSALIYESKLIKQYKPPYNTADKVYHNYPFIKITTNELFPRIELTFDCRNDGAEYFGPFRSISLAGNILTMIEKKFKIRKCSDYLSPSNDFQPCFYYQIKRCNAPCALLTSEEDYRLDVENVRSFLSGYSDGIIKQLEKQMLQLSDNLEFEKAEMLKRQIHDLKILFERKMSTQSSIKNNNFIFLLPLSEREKTFEIFIIMTGRLLLNSVIGRKASLEEIYLLLESNPIESNSIEEELTQEDIDEIRIINSYLYKRRDMGIQIHINGNDLATVTIELEHTIRNYQFESNLTESDE